MKPYRSRRSGRYTLLIVLLSLILMVLTMFILFFVAQEYFVFSAEGFRFAVSFVEEDGRQGMVEDSLVLHLEIEEPIASPDAQEEDTAPEPDPEPEPPEEQIYTAARLTTAEGLNSLALNTENGYAIRIKAVDGLWLISFGDSNSTAQEELSRRIAAFAADGISGTAIVSALRDAVAPREHRDSAIKTYSNVLWLDRDYIPWLNPYAQGTEDIIKSMVTVCADAGFEEVLLADFSFPMRGRIDLVDFGDEDNPANRMERLARLAEIGAAALAQAGTDCRLSVLLTSAAAANLSDGEGGQDVALLARYCHVLYVETSDPNLDVSALEAATAGTDCRIGLYLTTEAQPQQVCDYILAQSAYSNLT